jgi:hypothetical protein
VAGDICFNCCCEAQDPGTECCPGPCPEQGAICCLPDLCCGRNSDDEIVCCEEGEKCCDDTGEYYCCLEDETCCEGECCPEGIVCCDGVCCDEGECCNGGVCEPCGCESDEDCPEGECCVDGECGLCPCLCSDVDITGMIAEFHGKTFTVGTPETITENDAEWRHSYESIGPGRFNAGFQYLERPICPPGNSSSREVVKSVSFACDTDGIWSWVTAAICVSDEPDEDPCSGPFGSTSNPINGRTRFGIKRCAENALPEGGLDPPFVFDTLNNDSCEPELPSFSLSAADDPP